MATQTTYTDANGNKKTGYIINGKTYQDAAGTQRIGAGSIVTTAGGTYQLNADGTSSKVSPKSAPASTPNASTGTSSSGIANLAGNIAGSGISAVQKYAQTAAPGNQTAATTSSASTVNNNKTYYAPMTPGFQGSTSVDSSAYIDGSSADTIGKMNANSVAWHSAPEGSADTVGTKAWYAAQNQQLAQGLRDTGYTVEQGNGTWKISGGGVPAVDEALLEADKWRRQYEELMNANPRTDQSQYTSQVLTYDEAMALAQQYYDRVYGNATSVAQQRAAANLDRMGLYNSVYGQNMLSAAIQAEENAKADQIVQLAMDMVGKDRDYYTNLLSLAQNDNQNAADYYLNVQNSGTDAGLAFAQTVIDKLNADREYELAREAQIAELKYRQGLISQTQLQNMLLQLELAGEGGSDTGYASLSPMDEESYRTEMDKHIDGAIMQSEIQNEKMLADFDQIWNDVYLYATVPNVNGADAKAHELQDHLLNSNYYEERNQKKYYGNAANDFMRIAAERGYAPDEIRRYVSQKLQDGAGYSREEADYFVGLNTAMTKAEEVDAARAARERSENDFLGRYSSESWLEV